MSDPLVVVLPFTPVRALSPNGRVHWRTKHEYSSAQREQAKVATQNAILARGGALDLVTDDGLLSIAYHVHWEKGRKEMDDDNAISCMKAARDGICEALGIDDKALTTDGIRQHRDPDGRGFTQAVVWIRREEE